MSKVHDILEVCLNEIEQGVDIDTLVSNYPDLADELRPILETSIQARKMAVPVPPEEVVKRNRARLLQRAAEMREEQIASTRRVWFVPLRRVLVTLMVFVFLFVSGTNLVRASSNSLPGDGLYSVKRAWEDVLLFFTFDIEEREALEFEHEQNRLDELYALFAEGRSVEVEFSGYVTTKDGGFWQVSDVLVLILQSERKTLLPAQQVFIGSAVRVKGVTIGDGVVIAIQIELLPPGYKIPKVEKHEGSDSNGEQVSGTGSENKADASPVIIPDAKYKPDKETIEGIVTSIENNYVVVDSILLDIRNGEVNGVPIVGAVVKAEGYYDANGIFLVSKIEFMSVGSDNGNNSTNKNNGSVNSNDDDSTDDDDNDNDNDNSNDTDDD